MASDIFDRETMLDLTVNFIPLFIILFFIVGFAVFAPFGFEPASLGTIMQYVLLLFPFVALAVLTYFSAKVIVRDERAQEAQDALDEAAAADAAAVEADAESAGELDETDSDAESDTDGEELAPEDDGAAADAEQADADAGDDAESDEERSD